MKILIVGAGAGGLVTGYHFALSGVEVTFYVRPGRMEEMNQKPRRLYCYEDHEIKSFDEYAVTCEMEDVASSSFDYVLTTLDGAAMQSEEGVELLRGLGDAIRTTEAIFVCLGAAVGIEDFIVEHTGLPIDRCLFGSFSLLSHNVPLPGQKFDESIDQEALASCVFGYTHLGGGNAGLMLTRTNRELALKLAEVYGRSGVSTCTVLPNLRISDCATSLLSPAFAAFIIEGWPDPEEMYKTETWQLAQRAAMEIVALPQHGFLGKVVATLGGPLNLLAKMWDGTAKGAAPLDFNAFNRFHHGGKVMAQDLDISRDILTREEGRGRKLPALRSLLERLDA